jgi:hypothetical protein
MNKRIDRSVSAGKPRYGRIPDAQTYSGLGRSAIYGLAAEHEGLFRKAGGATIVDLQMLDQILAKLPPAKIKKAEAA